MIANLENIMAENIMIANLENSIDKATNWLYDS